VVTSARVVLAVPVPTSCIPSITYLKRYAVLGVAVAGVTTTTPGVVVCVYLWMCRVGGYLRRGVGVPLICLLVSSPSPCASTTV